MRVGVTLTFSRLINIPLFENNKFREETGLENEKFKRVLIKERHEELILFFFLTKNQIKSFYIGKNYICFVPIFKTFLPVHKYLRLRLKL